MNNTNTTFVISEVPRELSDRLNQFLSSRPEWDKDRAIVAALALFLLQKPETCNDSALGRIYLEATFSPSSGN